MTIKYKTGRLSTEEKDIIRDSWGGSNPEDIAAKLNRRVKAVEKYARQVALNSEGESTDNSILVSLHESAQWKELKKQFNKSELSFFEESWVGFNKQFNKDVLATEAFQITTVITIEILINRNLVERQDVGTKILNLKAEKEGLLKQMREIELGSDEAMGLATQAEFAEIQLANAESSIQSRTVEYRDFVEKKRQHYRELKATRDQRFKQLEDSRANFQDWIKELDTMDVVEREGREMALRLKAEEKASKDLTGLHEFQDGKIDSPILRPEDQVDVDKNPRN